jgi:hypothetical protein
MEGSQLIGGYLSQSILQTNFKPQIPNIKEKSDDKEKRKKLYII